jgi:4-oxalocrotonate tautomerase
MYRIKWKFGGVIIMPHVVVKLWPGRNDETKFGLAKKIAQDVADGLKVDIGDVSVAFEEVEKSDWEEMIYKKEIKDNMENIYFKPNY